MDVSLDRNKLIVNKPSDESKPRKVYMGPGIHEAVITGFQDRTKEEYEKQDEKKVPFISLTIMDESTGATHTERFYLGEKSNKYSKAKIGHIISVLCPGCDLTQMNTTDKIADAIIGKRGRWKINGEEYKGKYDKVYPRAKNFPLVRIYKGEAHGFVERLDQPSKMTFDFENPQDYKKLSDADAFTQRQMDYGPKTETPSKKGFTSELAPDTNDDLPF